MTVTEMRDALQALIDQGRGDEIVKVFECQYPEGDYGMVPAEIALSNSMISVSPE